MESNESNENFQPDKRTLGQLLATTSSDFATKKENGYTASKLEITRQLLQVEGQWSASHIEIRQATLLKLAEQIWPEKLT